MTSLCPKEAPPTLFWTTGQKYHFINIKIFGIGFNPFHAVVDHLTSIKQKYLTTFGMGLDPLTPFGQCPKGSRFSYRWLPLSDMARLCCLHLVSRMNVKHGSHLPYSPSSFPSWVIFLPNKPLISLLPASPHNRVGKTTYWESKYK